MNGEIEILIEVRRKIGLMTNESIADAARALDGVIARHIRKGTEMSEQQEEPQEVDLNVEREKALKSAGMNVGNPEATALIYLADVIFYCFGDKLLSEEQVQQLFPSRD